MILKNKLIIRQLKRIAGTPFVRSAIEENADLSAFKERPSGRVIAGVGLILFSYVIAWPLISLLGILTIYFNRPLLIIIGGPIAYGTSHLVFIWGMYLAGAKYSLIFLKWATRVTVLKLLRWSLE